MNTSFLENWQFLNPKLTPSFYLHTKVQKVTSKSDKIWKQNSKISIFQLYSEFGSTAQANF